MKSAIVIVVVCLIGILVPMPAFSDGAWQGVWRGETDDFHIIESNGVMLGDIRDRSTLRGTMIGVVNNKRVQGVIVYDQSVGTFNGGVNAGRFSLVKATNGSSASELWSAERIEGRSPARLQSFGAADDPVAPYEGTWRSSFGELKLVSVRSKYLIGDYGSNGILYGSAQNGRLSGQFTNGARIGEFEFKSTGPDSFEGRWKWSGSDNWQGSKWDAERITEQPGPMRKIGGGKLLDGDAFVRAEKQSYNRRERGNFDASDSCGPSLLTEHLPEFLTREISSGFVNICIRHDACYRLREKTQAQCDRDMTTAMDAMCDRLGSPENVACQLRADLFGKLLTSTIAAESYGAAPAGSLKNVRRLVIDDLITDDEFEVCARFFNPTSATQEYDLLLQDRNGTQIDIEPNAIEVNVGAGQTGREICVGTNEDPRYSYQNISFPLKLTLRADATRNFSDLVLGIDMVAVDTATIKKPARARKN